MIVKNESKIITRLFDSVLNIIDSYLICDTGSTDNTPSVINQYFQSRGIPGKVIVEPFKNFEYNRTFALNACQGQANIDYILLLDADMILEKGAEFDATKFNSCSVPMCITCFKVIRDLCTRMCASLKTIWALLIGASHTR